MRSVLILAGEKNKRTEYLTDVLAEDFRVLILPDADAVIAEIRAHADSVYAMILDVPSEAPDARKVVEYVEGANTYLFSIPILILTDAEHNDADEAFLNDTVIGLIELGTSPRIVRQRIEKANAAVNSFSFQEFSRMLKALPSLIYLKDAKGRYVFCSQYLHHLSHFNEETFSILGKTDLEVRKDPVNARAAYESDMRIIESGKGASYVIEENDDGIQEFLQIIKEPVRDGDGKVRGIIAIINNVTEQEKLRRELKRKSVTDELTGLNNRVYYDEFIARINEDIYPLGILSADCDGLKSINDLYGHPVGDEYIRMAATLLRSVLPEDTIKIRTGGDEFLALLPRTDEKQMQEYLEKLNEAQKMFSIKDRPLSVSFGADVMHGSIESIMDCISRSDQNMYRNKRAKASWM